MIDTNVVSETIERQVWISEFLQHKRKKIFGSFEVIFAIKYT